MASSRKDSKGYALHTGESQRKDGRYSFQFYDLNHVRHTVYASSLMDLRKREKQILNNRENGVDSYTADRISLNDMFDRYISNKYDLKPSTKTNYLYCYNHFVRETFGRRKISKIHYSDIREFYYSLLINKKMKANTLESIHTLLHPTFTLAIRDGLIRMNPSDGVMCEIKKSHYWDKPKRHALTIKQQKAFLNYLKEHKEYCGWKPVLTALMGTGCRIGELLGLRWSDVDFTERMININHTLIYRVNDDGVCNYYIHTPKTEAGIRNIPMIEAVYEALLDEYEIQSCIGFNQDVIDGYSGFIFTSGYGNVYTPASINRAIKRIYEAYNREEIENAKKHCYDPVLIPHFSAHHLRHTFCSRFCENETNVKVIQEIMGHSDISTTMNIYAEVTTEKKKEVLTNLENKILVM